MNSQLNRVEEQVTILQSETTTAADTTNPSVETPFPASEFSTEEKVRVEEFKISSDSLIARIKELIQQGKLRRLVIKNSQGRTLADIPLMAGLVGSVAGAIVFPIAAILATVGAFAAHLTVAVERKE